LHQFVFLRFHQNGLLEERQDGLSTPQGLAYGYLQVAE
jgi:hypothetical protein